MPQNKKSIVLTKAIALFNQQKYFDAHELLEEYWNTIDGPEKKYIQAFIQIAAALHLIELARYEGARKVLSRAEKNLEGYQQEYLNIDLINMFGDARDLLKMQS